MRFSSIFQPRIPEPGKAPGERSVRVEPTPPVVTQTPPELPEELDARVRLLGEWQIGEG